MYPTENQASLIKGCVDNLHFKGIKTFALNKNTWDYYTLDSAEFRTVINHLERWRLIMHSPIAQKIVFHSYYLLSKSIGSIFGDFDVVDYNFYSDVIYDKLIVYGKNVGIKQVISFWGSDFYRVSDSTKERRRKYIDLIDAIHLETINVKNDFLNYYNDYKKIVGVLEKLRKILKNIPIIFTIKRNTSDGEADITEEKYVEIYKEVCATKLVDFIDIEDSIGKDNMEDIIEFAKDMGTYVITTNHNLDHTPSKAECIATAKELEDMGADIIKIITKPSSKLDVVELLETTIIIAEHIANVPICTISIGEKGGLSRICGEFFGSCMTYGVNRKKSAPGQPNIEDLSNLFKLIHKNIEA